MRKRSTASYSLSECDTDRTSNMSRDPKSFRRARMIWRATGWKSTDPEIWTFRGTRVREVFKSEWLIDDEIDGDLGELLYVIDKNQRGCQHPMCVLDKMQEYQRGGDGREGS